MKGKIIVSAVSLILVVGVVIGAVVTVNKRGEDPQVKAQQRYVGAICSNTDDKKYCHDTLSSVNGTDPKEYIAAVVKQTTDSVIKAFNMSDRLTTEYGKENVTKMALDDCKDLLQFALDSLELSNNMVRDNSLQSVQQNTADIKNWLSAVISYQQACTESFDDENDGEKKIKEELKTGSLDNVEKATALALDIVAGLTNILEQFGLKLDLKPASRRLLGHVEVDNEGYPSWFSASDRKLLGKLSKKGWKAGPGVQPNAVVAKDGSGQFKTISAAIASYPKGFKGRFVIYVKSGVYKDENIIIPKYCANILMYGDGPGKTIISGSKHFPTKTMQTSTFANTAPGFIAKDITFENTAGAVGHQAVAFRNQGDLSALIGCHFLGYQDTLYAQTNRQFYRDCVITGTIDFIFGSSSTVIQKCTIIVRKPLNNQFNTVTADGTELKNMATGIVIQDCNIIPEQAYFPVRFQLLTYLGRPWKTYSRTVIMESNLGDLIHPDGWHIWEGNKNLDTCYIGEYANTGPSANTQRRVKWKGYRGLISKAEATQFTAGQFLKAGAAGNWLQTNNLPHYLGFKA